ncbi:MAG: hypothetical protein KDB27_04000 [Planctomycetales bacterium]|nr:hypothetical protein [Planctomycetales bacterium]
MPGDSRFTPLRVFVWALVVTLLAQNLDASTFIELSHPEFAVAEVHDMSQDGSIVVGVLGKEEEDSRSSYELFSWTQDDGLTASPWESYGFTAAYNPKISPDGSAVSSGWAVLSPNHDVLEAPFNVLAIPNSARQAVGVSGAATIDGWLEELPSECQAEEAPICTGHVLVDNGFRFAARDISADGDSVAAIRVIWEINHNPIDASEAFILHKKDGEWSPERLGTLQGDYASWPTAISADGAAVAGIVMEDSELTSHDAFVWSHSDGFHRIVVDGRSSRANDVSDLGAYVVGFSSDESSWCCTAPTQMPDSARALIWSRYRGLSDLEFALRHWYGLDDDDFGGMVLTSASKVSGDGMTISGLGKTVDGKNVGWVVQLDHPLDAWIGDADLNGEFNSGDLVAVFQAKEYEDIFQGNSTWATGDWNGDGDFTTSDLVFAFQDGGYEKGLRPAAVPEPSAAWSRVWLMLMPVWSIRRRIVRSNSPEQIS